MDRLNPPEGLTFSYQAIDMLVLLGQRDNPIGAGRSRRKRVGSDA
jgi:hypothetical protein